MSLSELTWRYDLCTTTIHQWVEAHEAIKDADRVVDLADYRKLKRENRFPREELACSLDLALFSVADGDTQVGDGTSVNGANGNVSMHPID